MSDGNTSITNAGCLAKCAIQSERKTSVHTVPKVPTADHPCYSEDAHHHYARMHLAVAPRCNIQCNYCNRRYDCPNENRPGVAGERLSPEEALARVNAVLERVPQTTVVGIAGPGDPLANPDKTFRTFELIKAAFPDVHLCLSTNGLALPDYLDDIHALGIEHVTVTVNAIDPEVSTKINPWIRYKGQTYRGMSASDILLTRQQEGLRGLVERNVLVKVNTVMIPGVNDHHLPEIAQHVHALGAFIINIMPLIPVKGSAFQDLRSPTLIERRAVQEVCEVDIRVMRHCRQCRADAVGLLGEDLSADFSKKRVVEKGLSNPDLIRRQQLLQNTNEILANRQRLKQEIASQAASISRPLTIAVCSRGYGKVNQHFGQAKEFLIYRVDRNGVQFLEARQVDRYCIGVTECGNENKMVEILDILDDCHAVLATQFGLGPEYELRAAGIEPLLSFELIELALSEAISLLKDSRLPLNALSRNTQDEVRI